MIGDLFMKNLIKAIREEVRMSQEQFAKELATTPVSINRWENGKVVPNLMAQKQLLEFCKKYNIDLSNAIIKKYKTMDTKDSFILYHGSKKGIDGNIIPKSREDCDFGAGFYMGTHSLQPLTLICGEDKPKFYIVNLELEGLKVLDIELGLDWVMLIAYHRGYLDTIKESKLYEKYAHYLDGYDVITGYIADDRLYTELNRFFKGDITDQVLMKCLSALDLGKQYVAKTKKACRKIKIVKEEAVSPFELAILQDMSTKRRQEGNTLARDIELQYRRVGEYFDEILKR